MNNLKNFQLSTCKVNCYRCVLYTYTLLHLEFINISDIPRASVALRACTRGFEYITWCMQFERGEENNIAMCRRSRAGISTLRAFCCCTVVVTLLWIQIAGMRFDWFFCFFSRWNLCNIFALDWYIYLFISTASFVC